MTQTKRLFYGRIFTMFGLGRLFHTVSGWDDHSRHMEISGAILQVWELIFESFPMICLQIFISLYTDLNATVLLSLLVGFASVSITFLTLSQKPKSYNSKQENPEHIITKVVTLKRFQKKPVIVALRNSRIYRNLSQNFVCCYPVKLCVGDLTKDENGENS
eukprot:355546_1